MELEARHGIGGNMSASLVISRATAPPPGFDRLLRESLSEGLRMLERLREEWELGENRFARPGEGFFVAKRGELLVGVCGLNRDPYASRARVGRSIP